jgi:formylglycine-generating enzyme required for sulfatase activity
MSSTFGPLSTTRYVVNGVSFDTIRVPPGRFVDGEGWDKRTLLVSRPFEVGVTLVTQALWRAVTGKSPSRFHGDDLPVDSVSWDDVHSFLAQLDALGLRGFRLPTEAEWSWAARCGVTTRWAGADRAKPVVPVGCGKVVPVGRLLPSAVGALDLSGNMLQWQQDWWSRDLAAGIDVQGPASEPTRVTRGGSWFSPLQYARVSLRIYGYPEESDSTLSVRLFKSTT